MSIRAIKYITKYEDLISRIPGLFAYIEFDDKGNSVLHKATDSPMGCYGKVVENVKFNNKIYSYKDLISSYYKNEIFDDELKNFIEKGIGKIEVNFNGIDRKKQDLVPDFVYLATVKPLYGEMLKLRDKVKFYEKHFDDRSKIDIETEESLVCVCQLYNRHGGDAYLNFLSGQLLHLEEVATEYFGYANDAINDQNRLCLNYAVNLFSTVKDMGLVTPMGIGERQVSEYNSFILEGRTNSKLMSLRRYEGYLNEFDVLETPPIGSDWLYYYRVGAVRNISTINDENGNIKCETTRLETITKGDIISDLYAFGDVIQSITPVDNCGIKFVYWTDVHLKAEVNAVKRDDDGNYRIYYKNFIPDYPNLEELTSYEGDLTDTDCRHGIRYEETYYYSPNEDEDNISSLIEKKEFENYVKGVYDDGQNIKKYEKYEFSINNNTSSYTQRINNTDLQLSCVMADYKTICVREKNNTDDSQEDGAVISRLPFYESISYTPVEKIDVFIDRGSTSVFDRHIRLSEVKTLNDMLEYSNGSYFIMQD